MEASGGVLRAPVILQRAPSLMRSPSQDPDGDFASARKDIKVRLDALVNTKEVFGALAE